jgi:hypothetical protein
LHILGDDLSLLSRQRDGAPNGLFTYAASHPGKDFRGLLDGFNEQWVTAATFLSPRVLLDLLRLAGDHSADDYEARNPLGPAEAVGIFGDAGSSPWWKVIAREYLERFVHHQQIRRALGSVDLDAPFVALAAEIAVHLFAVQWRGREPSDEMKVRLDFGRHGAWCVRTHVSDAEVEADGTAGATVTVAADAVAAVVSRGCSADELLAAMSTSGRRDLADSASAMLVSMFRRPG